MEILKDGSFICILRTDDGQGKSPMYMVRSFDKGKTWTQSKAITAYGVYPRLLLLDNGVLVMSSGRPGVSVRFSTDNGETWTEAFEQLPVPYTDEWNYTCGDTNMIPTGKNKFMIVYSDFKMKNEKGEERKAIKVREITVNKIK